MNGLVDHNLNIELFTVLILLVFLSIQDIRFRKIPNNILIFGIFLRILYLLDNPVPITIILKNLIWIIMIFLFSYFDACPLFGLIEGHLGVPLFMFL